MNALRFGPESYNGVYSFINRARTSAGKRVAQAVVANPSSDDSLKLCAQTVLKRIFSTGQTLAFEFTALDGRQVNLPKMRGKVVLVDFGGQLACRA